MPWLREETACPLVSCHHTRRAARPRSLAWLPCHTAPGAFKRCHSKPCSRHSSVRTASPTPFCLHLKFAWHAPCPAEHRAPTGSQLMLSPQFAWTPPPPKKHAHIPGLFVKPLWTHAACTGHCPVFCAGPVASGSAKARWLRCGCLPKAATQQRWASDDGVGVIYLQQQSGAEASCFGRE